MRGEQGTTADDPRTMVKFRLMLMLVGSYTRFQKSNLVLLLNKKNPGRRGRLVSLVPIYCGKKSLY